jgi:hypothetical protein
LQQVPRHATAEAEPDRPHLRAGYSALELVDAGLEIRNQLLWRGVRKRGRCGRWIS